MDRELRVSFIGESVLVEGILLQLEQDPTVHVQRVCAATGDALHRLSSFRPDVIVYPLGIDCLERIVAQVEPWPGLRVIGLDVNCNQTLVRDNWLLASLSMAELQQLISAPVVGQRQEAQPGPSVEEDVDKQVLVLEVEGVDMAPAV